MNMMMGHFLSLLSIAPIYLLVFSPLVLVPWNIGSFILCLLGKKEKTGKIQTKYGEVFGIFAGAVCTYLIPLETAWESSWWEPITSLAIYPPVAAEHSLTFYLFCFLGFVGYGILRFRPIEKQAPLLSVFSISSIYVGIILCFIWCYQIFGVEGEAFFYLILPMNVILIYVKTILLFVRQKTAELDLGVEINHKSLLPFLEKFLIKAEDYPKIAFLCVLPLLTISVLILLLFGQKPDSLVAMWTETAEWNLSQQIPPPRLDHTGHYLCTVAACGSQSLVKPLWVGERGGQKILVNRQLAIANAFEQILEEKTPSFHHVIRTFYDKTGYPISRHITTAFWSNITYLLMKPLEWCFLIVLYLVDVKPEQRIARQYRGKVK
ncbi:MAG: DUF6688 family protein [Eubacteriales bacterium]